MVVGVVANAGSVVTETGSVVTETGSVLEVGATEDEAGELKLVSLLLLS